ncbi:MAG: hypothetical protein IT514_02790 [Burkholderiales bacterium]|nr:hypothetical protein [Burkholderiales bacterium]
MNARRGLAAICAVLLGAASPAASAQPAHAQRQASGLLFHYGLVPSEMVLSHPQSHAERRMHPADARKDRSHLALAIFDAASGEPIARAEVMVHITRAGGASTTKALEPMDIAAKPSFGAFVPVGAPGVHEIRFEVRRPGVAGAESAEFEHRIAGPKRL